MNNEVLEEEDFADGYILACQALPVTDTVSRHVLGNGFLPAVRGRCR